MPTGSMLTSETLPQSNGDTSLQSVASPLAPEIEEILLKGFGSGFTVIDGDDGQRRITRGPNFYLVGGSQRTHEHLTKIAVKINEKVDERDKRLEDINARELSQIVEEVKDMVEELKDM